MTGYASSQRAYRLWNKLNLIVVLSNDVLIDEDAIVLKFRNANPQRTEFDDGVFDCSTSDSLHNIEAESNHDNMQAATETFTKSELK